MKRHKKPMRKQVLMQYQGTLIKDIYEIMSSTRGRNNASYKRILTSIHHHGIRSFFPANGGEASFLSRKGYAE